VKELECSKQPYRNGTTVLGNLTLLLGVPDDADREARITLTPSIKASALDLVPARLTVFSAWVRWEALPVGEAVLVELPEVHEPLFVVVVVPVVARLPARWANRTLDNSITMENERIVLCTAPPFWIFNGASRAESCGIEAPLRWLRFLRKTQLRIRIAPAIVCSQPMKRNPDRRSRI
jgi:hypothetical protein